MGPRDMKSVLMYRREEMDKRADKIIKNRAMHRERRERQASEKVANEIEGKVSRRVADLGGEDIYQINKEKDNELRQAKYTQILRNSPEIRDLMKHLNVAYVRKGLNAQVQHQRLEKINRCRTNDEEERIINDKAESDETLLVSKNQSKTEYNQQLQKQLMYKNKLKEIEYKNFVKEKSVLEEKIKKVHEEDQLVWSRDMLKRDKYKKEIEDDCTARLSWSLKEKEQQQLNEYKIKEFIKSKEKFNEEVEEKERIRRGRLNNKKDLVYKAMSQLYDTKIEKEKAYLRFCEQEAEQKFKENEKQEWTKKQKMKQELLNSYALILQDRDERKRREKLDDEIYMKEKLAQYQEDKKCLEMTNEKRRRLKMAYKSCVLREMEEKKIRRKLEEETINEFKEEEQFKSKELKKLINEERIKILKEHTGILVGYLPAGTLNLDDLPHMPDNVREYYSGKKSVQPEPASNS